MPQGEEESHRSGVTAAAANAETHGKSTTALHQNQEIITQIGPDDVKLGRGAPTTENAGNIKLRQLVTQRHAEYSSAVRHKDKHEVALRIYREILSRGGRFLRRVRRPQSTQGKADEEEAPHDEAWVAVTEEKEILSKIKQLCRDMAPDALSRRVERRLYRYRKLGQKTSEQSATSGPPLSFPLERTDRVGGGVSMQTNSLSAETLPAGTSFSAQTGGGSAAPPEDATLPTTAMTQNKFWPQVSNQPNNWVHHSLLQQGLASAQSTAMTSQTPSNIVPPGWHPAMHTSTSMFPVPGGLAGMDPNLFSLLHPSVQNALRMPVYPTHGAFAGPSAAATSPQRVQPNWSTQGPGNPGISGVFPSAATVDPPGLLNTIGARSSRPNTAGDRTTDLLAATAAPQRTAASDDEKSKEA